MSQPAKGRKVYFWQPKGGSSPVPKDLKKLPKPVFAFFADRLQAYAADPESATPPKQLRHVGRIAEYVYKGAHGHYRLLLIGIDDYVLVLDVFKKQKNSTETGTAESRLEAWNKWH